MDTVNVTSVIKVNEREKYKGLKIIRKVVNNAIVELFNLQSKITGSVFTF